MFRIVLLSLAIASFSSACFAQMDEDMPSVAVKYADLDLNTREGAHALVARINVAAERVCGAAYYADIQVMDQVKACRQDAVSSAVSAINKPMVFAAAHLANPNQLAHR